MPTGITRPEIEDALRDLLAASTGIAWIRAKPLGETPMPAMPYGTYELAGTIAVGWDEELVEDTPGAPAGREITISSRGQRRMRCSLNVYGRAREAKDDPSVVTDKILSRFQSSKTHFELSELGISIFDVSQVRDLDTLENNRFVARSQLDVFFYTVAVLNEEETYASTVEFTSLDNVTTPNPLVINLES